MKESVETLASTEDIVSSNWKTEGRSQWRQTLTTAVVNIISFVAGVTYGWAAPILPILQSRDSPTGIPPITDVEASWLASIVALSRIAAIPVFMQLNDMFGRKVTGYLVAAPFIVGSIALLLANSFPLLLFGRFMNGVGAGASAILVPAYVGDIAGDDVKGQLGLVYGLEITSGMVFSYIMGSYTSYTTFSICNLMLPAVYVLFFFFTPESPLFLVTQGKEQQAKENLSWLRNREDNEKEMERLNLRAKKILERKKEKISFSRITEKPTLRGLLICLGLIANQQLSGIAAIASFTVAIFQESGSTIDPKICTIIFGVVQILGTLTSSIVIERCGRRFLLLFSDVLMALTLIVLGTYSYVQSIGWNTQQFGWIPVTCLSFNILAVGIGLGPLPFSIVTELISSHSLGIVQCIILVFWSATSFSVIMVFTMLKQLIGQHGCFWLFSGVCVVSSVCIYLTVPETKNRSLEDIVEQLKGKKYIISVIHHRNS